MKIEFKYDRRRKEAMVGLIKGRASQGNFLLWRLYFDWRYQWGVTRIRSGSSGYSYIEWTAPTDGGESDG